MSGRVEKFVHELDTRVSDSSVYFQSRLNGIGESVLLDMKVADSVCERFAFKN